MHLTYTQKPNTCPLLCLKPPSHFSAHPRGLLSLLLCSAGWFHAIFPTKASAQSGSTAGKGLRCGPCYTNAHDFEFFLVLVVELNEVQRACVGYTPCVYN